jgi:hypothetical protein
MMTIPPFDACFIYNNLSTESPNNLYIADACPAAESGPALPTTSHSRQTYISTALLGQPLAQNVDHALITTSQHRNHFAPNLHNACRHDIVASIAWS